MATKPASHYDSSLVIKEVHDLEGQNLRVVNSRSVADRFYTHFRATYNGSAPTEVIYYKGTAPHRTEIGCVADVVGSLAGKHFSIFSAPDQKRYYVWYSVAGKSLFITDVRINSVVTTALAGGPVIYSASLAYGHTAVSLATTESATTKAPRRLALGIMSYTAAAAVGVSVSDVDVDLAAGVPVAHPGEFVQIALRNLGTVTTTGAITFIVSITGYWE